MEEKLTAAQNILKKYHQEQLLSNYEKLTEEKKLKLLDQILTIDFSQIEELFKRVNQTVDLNSSNIEPIQYKDKSKMSEEEIKHYEEVGLKAIKNGELAAVTMAGGQGTRLGHNGPKGTFDIGLNSHKPIFEILCETLKTAKEKYGVYCTWYIMTSNENNEATVSFFEKNNYFEYPKDKVVFFKQGELPMIDTKGKILIGEDGLIKQAADGHGGIFLSMKRNGIIFDMESRGIKWAFIGGVDNVLVNMIDPVFLGLAIEEKVQAAGKSVVKAGPHEKVGVFCKRNGKPSVVEYSEISNEMAEATNENGELIYGESHILCNLFSVEAIEEISKNTLPYHSAFKKAKYLDEEGNVVTSDTPNAYKFEAFLFDAFESLKDMAILRVKREEEFAPVKNAEGVDSPETARELYKAYHKIK
jgi:UDP-N-acetylglucosamine/UDP-N-acetylgalactosamine diphosphorylase